jgi:flavin reductase (DIM6/NTAB) family NADH-FMN oxidoreductase RutF
MPISVDLFRRACSQFATGVCIATAFDGEKPHGLTVNSFTSVSLQPPLVLFCIDKEAAIAEAFTRQAYFAVNILSDRQQALSSAFAFRMGDRFEGVAWTPGTGGAPVIEGSLAVLECRLVRVLPAGDHYILIGETLNASVREGEPLGYFRGRYARVGTPSSSL